MWITFTSIIFVLNAINACIQRLFENVFLWKRFAMNKIEQAPATVVSELAIKGASWKHWFHTWDLILMWYLLVCVDIHENALECSFACKIHVYKYMQISHISMYIWLCLIYTIYEYEYQYLFIYVYNYTSIISRCQGDERKKRHRSKIYASGRHGFHVFHVPRPFTSEVLMRSMLFHASGAWAFYFATFNTSQQRIIHSLPRQKKRANIRNLKLLKHHQCVCKRFWIRLICSFLTLCMTTNGARSGCPRVDPLKAVDPLIVISMILWWLQEFSVWQERMLNFMRDIG